MEKNYRVQTKSPQHSVAVPARLLYWHQIMLFVPGFQKSNPPSPGQRHHDALPLRYHAIFEHKHHLKNSVVVDDIE